MRGCAVDMRGAGRPRGLPARTFNPGSGFLRGVRRRGRRRRGGRRRSGRRNRLALLEQPAPVDLTLQYVLVLDHELDAPVLRAVEIAGVRRDRLALAVALDDELLGLELLELEHQVAQHRARPRLAQLLVERGAAATVGVAAD